MRSLMWFTVGFALACIVGIWLVWGVFFALLAMFALAAAIGLFSVRTWLSKITAVILLGFSVGALWLWGFDTFYLDDARQYDTLTVVSEATVVDYSYETTFGVATDAKMQLDGKTYKVRLYLPEGKSLSPGDVIRGEFRLRLTTLGAIQAQTHHQGKGIFLLAYISDDPVITQNQGKIGGFLAVRLRRLITDILDTAFPDDTEAFARALLLGDSGKLTYAQDTAFKISGIRHVIAVSGLHISILFSLICVVSGKKRIITTLIGVPVLVLFAAVAGFTPSVVRACIMQVLMILALLLNREYDPPTALAFAVLAMLVVNPMTITSVSFQLSVGCLLGIFLFYRPIYNHFTKKIGGSKKKRFGISLLQWIVSSFAVTLCAMIATTPLCAYYFGSISIVGPLTNLLTLWVVSFIFYGIMLVCLLGTFWVAGAKVLAMMVAWPIRYVLSVAELLSKPSFSAVYTCSIYIVIWLAFCYLLLLLFLLSRRKRAGILFAVMAIGLVISTAASCIEPRLDRYRITVLDVGQGQCILWQCDGRNYLVDCGGDDPAGAADAAAHQLLSQGITKLDGLILTHYDEDHAAGAVHLLTRVQTDMLYIPDIDPDSGIRQHLETMYADTVCLVKQDMVLNAGETEITLFAGKEEKDDNESGLCILFQTENCDILITGDRSISGERALLAGSELPDLEILVAGHHGSKHSTGIELLHATTPEIVVISVGEQNYYGHPAQELLDRLKLYGCSIWRTDLDHTITFRG